LQLAYYRNNIYIFIKYLPFSPADFVYFIVVEFDSYDKINSSYCFLFNLSDENLMLYLGDINSFIFIPVSKQQVPYPWGGRFKPVKLSCFTKVILDHIKNNPEQKTDNSEIILREYSRCKGTSKRLARPIF